MGKMKKKWLLSIMAILVVALIATGCANDTPPEDTDMESSEDIGDKVTDAGEDAKDAVDDTVKEVEDDLRDMNYEDIEITAEDVFGKFMDLHPDAKITEIELDKELMEYEYIIEGYDTENKYELKLDPVNARVISEDQEVFELDDEEGAEITMAHIEKVDGLIEKAKMEDGSDSELDEWKISVDDGKVLMEIEIGMKEYTYDMETEMLVD